MRKRRLGVPNMSLDKLLLAAAAAGLWLCSSGVLRAADSRPEASAPYLMDDFSAQSRYIRRSRTQIEVYPRRSRFPGPNAKRDCVSWLEPEWRPSGTVIVPRLRCWWVRG
jgi:hypothetical protein